MKTIAFGEIIWDVYPDEAIIGGAPFNFCAHLAHLGDTAYLASATGEDKLGKDALAVGVIDPGKHAGNRKDIPRDLGNHHVDIV